ncbi:linear amide C-N hydrolase [Roseibium sediminicola]|uniref:Linear amide C-N hydrolase n=1 Tax=Roseibium sediminicola TaxID=2933272 RepID=A0ABT0H0Q8_9HYPH|nr:linear amide C-N hydrolase [Roseibium sp. CAU 1639]MCK7615275.1 linear amide C-N hydrolase [Roseibium sp. CAU 1639]
MTGLKSRRRSAMPLLLPVILSLHFLTAAPAGACSTLAFPDPEQPVLAFNFDFAETGAGFLIVNVEGIERRSVMDGNGARWSARYGSVTVNQVGPGMPTAGMNTAGLAITLMWNEAAIYGGSTDAPTVSELEFIQFLLDTSGSVEEALAKLETVRIEGVVPIHYFLFDRTGAAAILTPAQNGLQVHTGDSLPVPALTNTSYAAAIEHIGKMQGFGGKVPMPEEQRPGETNSLDRFAIAAGLTGAAKTSFDPQSAFAALDRLANRETRWQVVFEPQSQAMRLRLKGHAEDLVIDLGSQNFACRGAPVGAALSTLTPDTLQDVLQPLEGSGLAASLAEVLGSMSETAHLGQPEVARGLAAGLIAASSCTPE